MFALYVHGHLAKTLYATEAGAKSAVEDWAEHFGLLKEGPCTVEVKVMTHDEPHENAHSYVKLSHVEVGHVLTDTRRVYSVPTATLVRDTPHPVRIPKGSYGSR